MRPVPVKTQCTVLAAIFSVAVVGGCRTGGADSQAREVRSLFLADLRARGITVRRETADGQFVLAMNGFTLTSSLDNIEREYNLTHDPEVVHQFVRSLADSWPADLTWAQAKANLLYIVEPASMDIGDSIKAP